MVMKLAERWFEAFKERGVCIGAGDVTPERLAKWCSAVKALNPKGRGYQRSVIRGEYR